MVGTPEYKAWESMRYRCCNPQHPQYPEYGGRGIWVCPRWQASFLAFLEDMGPKPSPEHSIDRVDNDRGYCLANCRWATKTQQGRNKRDNRMLTVGDETHCVSEWAEITGIKRQTLFWRLDAGWSPERAVHTATAPGVAVEGAFAKILVPEKRPVRRLWREGGPIGRGRPETP
jgi:hypothetical protein